MITDVLKGKFKDKTIVCVASGPSLSIEQINYIKEKNAVTFVCNSTYKDFPNAEVLFSFDHRWYKYYEQDLKENFKGARFCKDAITQTSGLALNIGKQDWFKSYGNSGATLLKLALHTDSPKILLVGYDCKFNGKKKHYHEDHPEPLKNCTTIDYWVSNFYDLRDDEPSSNERVINCSLDTDLHIFKRSDLFKEL